MARGGTERVERAFVTHGPRASRVEIPYEGTTLPAYVSAAPAADDGPAPVIVLDSTKEHMCTWNHWEELAARGISCRMLATAVQRRRDQREGERPVPHYWSHVLWVWGIEGDEHHLDAFVDVADGVHLNGVVGNIPVPFLVSH